MLLQFSVENFRSFKNRAILSMECSNDKNLVDNTVELGGERFFNVACIFGANAAGKSNIFKALTSAIVNVRSSNNLQLGQSLAWITPFAFDEESKNKPSKFEFTFLVNKKKYVYGFSAFFDRIEEEYLYVYKSAKPSKIFERDGEKYNIPVILRNNLLPLTERTAKNKLFLAVATSWNSIHTREAFSWFMDYIDTYSQENIYGQMSNFFNDNEGKLRDFTLKLLRMADINIVDYNVKPRIELNTPTAMAYDMITQHEINIGGKIVARPLNFLDESDGTKYVFSLGPMIKKAFEQGRVICFDEFDAHLHPILLKYMVSLFNNSKQNKMNAQLIISAHSMTLLDNKFMRKDQIYFVEKDRNTGISELYSLDEFSVRKTENIRRMYLDGRYGSIPNIDGGTF